MALKIYIWKNTPNRVGHSSLEVGFDYLSFWPARAANGKKDVKFNELHESDFAETVNVDRRLMKGSPDETIVLWNLDEKKMRKKIREIKNDKWQYNMKSCNCSSVVALVLEEGVGKPAALKKSQYAVSVSVGMGGLILKPLVRLGLLKLWSPNALLLYANLLVNEKGPDLPSSI